MGLAFPLMGVALPHHAGAVLHGGGAPPQTADSVQQAAHEILAPFDRDDAPGVVVAVVQEGKVTYEHAVGMADVGQAVPLSMEMRLNIGSVAKPFTAFAMVHLAQEGHLDLDDDIRDYLPELPDLGSTVTIRHLLTHTSGYREILNALAIGGWRIEDGDHISRDEALAVVRNQPRLQNEPGREWNYNNTGYMLLALVVEEVTGAPFPKWMAQNLFGPLGMEDTWIQTHLREIVPRASRGYLPAGEGFREAPDLGEAMGAGSVYTTAHDLARWMGNMGTGAVGGRGVLEAMATPFTLNNGEPASYGLGLMVDRYRGLARWHHPGGDAGHQAHLIYYPEVNAGLIVMSNNGSFPGSVTRQLEDLFFDQWMDPFPEAQVAVEEDTRGSPDAPDADPLSGEREGLGFDPDSFEATAFDAFAGRYELQPGFILTFRREGERLLTQGTGQPAVDLVPVSDSSFALDGIDARVTFQRNQDGQVAGLTLHQAGEHFAPRLPDDETGAQVELGAFEGRYYSPEFQNFLEVEMGEVGLVVRQRRRDPVELTHVEGDRFVGPFPLLEVIFQRDDSGAVAGMEASAVRARGIGFERVR